jgi:uncharacterized DUF497 family protein
MKFEWDENKRQKNLKSTDLILLMLYTFLNLML